MRAHRLEQSIERALVQPGRRGDLDETELGSLRSEAIEDLHDSIEDLARIDARRYGFII